MCVVVVGCGIFRQEKEAVTYNLAVDHAEIQSFCAKIQKKCMHCKAKFHCLTVGEEWVFGILPLS